MSDRSVVLTLNYPGERLDRALVKELSELSRTQIQRLIEEGLVEINAEPVKASLRLSGGEQVSVTIPATKETEIIPEAIALDIQYEDDDIILVNKPAGMVVHPAPGHEGGTLVNAILAHDKKLLGVGGERRPGIVHRLDKETSGLIVVAKNDHSLNFLQSQFRKRSITKVYIALVDGHFSQRRAIIDAPIGRDTRDRKKMAVISPGSSATARPARTEVETLAYYGLPAGVGSGEEFGFTLLECRPQTGRTHQIRVHLAFTGYPIAGDTTYGFRKQRLDLNRHFLHASSLTFKRPSDGKQLTFTCPLPAKLQAILDSLTTQI